jgi:hypothetical protein
LARSGLINGWIRSYLAKTARSGQINDRILVVLAKSGKSWPDSGHFGQIRPAWPKSGRNLVAGIQCR